MKKSFVLGFAVIFLCAVLFSCASTSSNTDERAALEGCWYFGDDSGYVFMKFSGPRLYLDFEATEEVYIFDGTYRLRDNRIYMTITSMTTGTKGKEKTEKVGDISQEINVGSYSLNGNVLKYTLLDTNCILVRFSPEETELEGVWKKSPDDFEYMNFHGSYVQICAGESGNNGSLVSGNFSLDNKNLNMRYYTAYVAENGVVTAHIFETSDNKTKKYVLDGNKLIVDDEVYMKVSE